MSGSFAFGLPRSDKPLPKERKESKNKEGILYTFHYLSKLQNLERSSLSKKLRISSKDNCSPKVAIKSIKVIKNGQEITKVNSPAINRGDNKECNDGRPKDRMYSDERKRIPKECISGANQSPIPK